MMRDFDYSGRLMHPSAPVNHLRAASAVLMRPKARRRASVDAESTFA